jgi:hypothetical protein
MRLEIAVERVEIGVRGIGVIVAGHQRGNEHSIAVTFGIGAILLSGRQPFQAEVGIDEGLWCGAGDRKVGGWEKCEIIGVPSLVESDDSFDSGTPFRGAGLRLPAWYAMAACCGKGRDCAARSAAQASTRAMISTGVRGSIAWVS